MSNEPADVEAPDRRAYFTDLSRQEVMDYYKEHFRKHNFMGLHLLTLNLNYPPEDANFIIRDQTRSVFLEEVLHPFRQSVFINGFKANSDKDIIFIENKIWQHKITVKFISSNPIVRSLVGVLAAAFLWIVLENWTKALKFFTKKKK